jgi:mediator of RNA polymerase II transcription subunit 14
MSLAVRIPVTGPLNATYAFLGILERMAVAIITLYVHQVALAHKGVLHKLQPSKVANPKLTIPDLYIRFSSLTKEHWAVDVLKLSFQGLGADGLCKLVVLGRTKEPMTQLGSTNMSAADNDVSFHPQSGSFAVRFTVAVGETIIEPLIEKLIRIERLIRLVAIIRRFLLPCLTVSLGRITFRYSQESTSTADVSFSGEREMKLHLPPNSPHLRIKRFLENELNTDGLERVIIALKVTLPLLIAFDKIEALVQGQGDGVIFVLPRAIDWFRVEYRSIGVVLDWRLKIRKSILHWFVQDAISGNLEAEGNVKGSEGRRKAHELAGMWDGVAAGQWVPLKCGAAAELSHVTSLALWIHELLCPAAR